MMTIAKTFLIIITSIFLQSCKGHSCFSTSVKPSSSISEDYRVNLDHNYSNESIADYTEQNLALPYSEQPNQEVASILGNRYEEDFPISTDSRIKTYIYNPGGVYLLVLHFGFQSHIEFSKGEEVESIVLGDTYAWKINPLENRLFINPMEKNIRTNMTVITNKKRTYQFDLISKELDKDYERDLVYTIRFYYPKKRSGI